MSLTASQKAFIQDNYGGEMSNVKINKVLKLKEGQLNRFIMSFTTTELNEHFKHFKKNIQREFYDPLVEPDMTPVHHSIQIIGKKTIYTFQSRINY